MRLIVQLKGVDTLSLRTKALIEAARQGVKLGSSEAAQILVEEEKALVPVKTGRLRDSIHSELVEDTDTRTVYAVSPDTPYARRIEYGFVGADALGRVYHQEAQPYVRPTWDNKQAECRQTIVDSIYSELEGVHH